MVDKMALVTLTERGGYETVYIVPKFVLAWINQPYKQTRQVSIYEEPVPTDVLTFFENSADDNQFMDRTDVPAKVNVTIGSAQNDRALQMVVGDTFTFESTRDAVAYAKSNGIDIVDSFNGLFY